MLTPRFDLCKQAGEEAAAAAERVRALLGASMLFGGAEGGGGGGLGNLGNLGRLGNLGDVEIARAQQDGGLLRASSGSGALARDAARVE